MFGQFETSISRAQRDRAAPGERNIAAFDRAAIGVDCFRIAVEPIWIAAYIRPDTLAGLYAIPAAGDDCSHLDDAERSHHRIAGVVAPGVTDTFGVASGFDQHIEKFLTGRGIARELAVVDEFRDGGLGLCALHTVDRVGVVA